MYGANLSTIQLKKYLGMLVKIDCLAYDEKNRLFRITQKGNDLLEAIYNVSHAKEELHRSQAKLEIFIESGHAAKDASNRLFPLTQLNGSMKPSRSSKFTTSLVDIESRWNRK